MISNAIEGHLSVFCGLAKRCLISDTVPAIRITNPRVGWFILLVGPSIKQL